MFGQDVFSGIAKKYLDPDAATVVIVGKPTPPAEAPKGAAATQAATSTAPTTAGAGSNE